MDNEVETYFPTEFYGEFEEADILYEDSLLSKYPLIDEKVLVEVPDFSPKCYQPFLSPANLQEKAEICVGPTQVETTNANSAAILEGKLGQCSPFIKSDLLRDVSLESDTRNSTINNIRNNPTSGENLTGDVKTLATEHKDSVPETTLTEVEDSKQDYQHLKFQCRPRWGRDMDKKLFKTLRDMERTGEIFIDEVLMLDPKYEAPYHAGIQKLSEVLRWKGQLKCLVHRIQKLAQPQDFSVRDKKLLRKQLRTQYSNKPVNYDELIYHFPGKSIEDLKELCKEILSGSNFNLNC